MHTRKKPQTNKQTKNPHTHQQKSKKKIKKIAKQKKKNVLRGAYNLPCAKMQNVVKNGDSQLNNNRY